MALLCEADMPADLGIDWNPPTHPNPHLSVHPSISACKLILQESEGKSEASIVLTCLMPFLLHWEYWLISVVKMRNILLFIFWECPFSAQGCSLLRRARLIYLRKSKAEQRRRVPRHEKAYSFTPVFGGKHRGWGQSSIFRQIILQSIFSWLCDDVIRFMVVRGCKTNHRACKETHVQLKCKQL